MSVEKGMSRRQLLRRAGALGVGLAFAGPILGACGPTPTPQVIKETVVVEKEKVVTKIVAGTPVKEVVKETVVVEKPVTQVVEKLVTKEVIKAPPAEIGVKTIRYWELPTTEQAYRQQMMTEFELMNPDIKVKMEGTDPSKYNEATMLLFKGGEWPDVFWKFGLTLQQMVAEDYIQPYPAEAEKYIKSAYPPYMFIEGINLVNGRLMGYWPVGKGSAVRVLYIHDEIFQKAGVKEAPKTWTEFREVAKKLTAAGGGKFYGLILGGKSPWDYTGLVGPLAMSAGPMASTEGEAYCIDWHKAEMTIAEPYFVDALKLLMDMMKDGSIFPGFSSISHTEARAGVPSGWAGMYLAGWWDAGAYNTQFKDFKYSVAPPPVYDGGKKGYNHGSLFIDRVYVSKKTKVLDAVNRFLLFKFGPAYQRGWVRNGWFSTLPEVNVPENITDPRVRTIFSLVNDIRSLPDPIARNPEQSKVSTEQKAIQPNWGAILEGVFTGQIPLADYAKRAKDYATKWRAELERAIKELAGKGVKVSVEDWFFPNWDPSKDYTSDMYAQLPKAR